MAPSVKEHLHHTIDQLSEEECRRVLEFAQALQQALSTTSKQMVNDSTFRFPSEKLITFQAVEPIQGKGIPASKLLMEDRR